MTDRMFCEFELTPGELLRAGEVRIVVREIRGAELRLSVEAPRHVIIVRDELLGRRRTARPGCEGGGSG